MRKTFITLLIFCFVATTFNPLQLEAAQFKDISNHWAKTYIENLTASGYIKGYNDGTFRPDNPISRAEFITLLNACMGAAPSNATVDSFNDIKSHWARKQINKAVENGILIPAEYNGLKPDGYIKRSEVAAMLIRALGEKPDMGTTPPFSDISDVLKSDYKGYIKKAFDLKLLSGFPGGSFKPFADMTRGQVAKVLIDFNTLKGTTPSVIPGTTWAGNISSIKIGANQYNTTQISLAFKFGYTVIPVTSINASADRVIINNSNQFMLNSFSNNPDIIINDILYEVDNYRITNNILEVSSAVTKIGSLTVDNYKYYADYVKLYVNSEYGDQYLSDMEIIDQYTVRINSKEYDLLKDRLTIALKDKFYDITKINLNNASNPVSLVEAERVIVSGMSIDDISAIFEGSSTINLRNIKKFEVLINNELYSLREVVIDAGGNFTVNRKSYPYKEVLLSIDGQRYTIDELTMYKDKFIFYCTESDFEELVLVNDKYRDTSAITFLKGNTAYDFEEVVVVRKNLIRIDGKQYTVDSSYRIRMDNRIYEINRIDYDDYLDVVTMKVTEVDSSLDYQPDKYIFYVDDEKYQDGINANTLIYVDRNWIAFSKISIFDPSSFSYRNDNYDLIGADVKLNQSRFEIVDTTWSGRTGILKIYLE